MHNSISIEDLNSISIHEEPDGRINFTFRSENSFIDIDCGIPANLTTIITSHRPDSEFISKLEKETEMEIKYARKYLKVSQL